MTRDEKVKRWKACWDVLVPRLRSPHWDKRPARLDCQAMLATLFLNKAPTPGAQWLRAQVEDLLAHGDAVAVERLGTHFRRSGWFAGKGDYKPTAVVKLLALMAGPPAVPSVAYTFKRERSHVLKDLEKLSAADTWQFLAAAASYAGHRFRSAAAFCRAEAKDLRETPDSIEVVRWRISPAGSRKATHELWVFGVDNGAVFELGAAKPCGVHAVQGYFEVTRAAPRKDRAALEAFAAALQQARPF
jgi:hypothetical protein